MNAVLTLARWCAAALTAAALMMSPAVAQDDEASIVLPPDARYDPAIPSIEEQFGVPVGQRITPSADIMAYFRALEAAAPDRLSVRSIGRSWQGRELAYVIIASPENMANLDSIQSSLVRLADPRITPREQADEIITNAPSIVWLAYSVHGNEISNSDAAMATAYHLLAAQDDPVVDTILANTIVILDPVQNPDGRDRFVTRYYDSLGLEPQGSVIAAERNQQWPSGRVNHYLFDMNRDWIVATQPETRARIAAYLEWYPHIFVDLHEMGANSTYYFSPEAVPFHPNITERQRAFLGEIGQNNAKFFDALGFRYYTREVFDALYPGYGAAWPLFHGAIGTTYEMASARGLTADRDDGSTLTFAMGVRRHFTTSIATAETAAIHRERLLGEFYDYRASAIAEGRDSGVRTYVIPTQTDQATADKLASTLALQGIEVFEAGGEFNACGRTYGPGAYVIPTDQPSWRLIDTLLAESSEIDPVFMAEQERRRAAGLPVELYDVTAWSLPLMFNVTTDRCDRSVGLDGFTATTYTPIRPGSFTTEDNAVAYLAPWGSVSAARLLAALLRDEAPVYSQDLPFTLNERVYPAGTLIIMADEAPGLEAALPNLAQTTGAEIIGVASSWVTDGPNFGSDNVVRHLPPAIALAWDEPTSQLSAGATRFIIERELGYPVTPVRTDDLNSAYLSTFDVVVIPAGGGYAAALGSSGVERLRDWVREGGVVIGLGSATRFLAAPDTGLSDLRRETAPDGNGDADSDSATVEGQILSDEAALEEARAPGRASPPSVPGVLARADVAFDHWMSAGLAPTLHPLVRGGDIYAPLSRSAGATIARFAGPEDILASGYLWEESRAQLAFKPFITVERFGRGHVIAFTQDPTVRGYLDGLHMALANAVFRGPAHASPPR